MRSRVTSSLLAAVLVAPPAARLGLNNGLARTPHGVVLLRVVPRSRSSPP